MTKVKAILKFFASCSGLKINLDKSTLVGINVENFIQEAVAAIGCEVGEWPMNIWAYRWEGIRCQFWLLVIEKVGKNWMVGRKLSYQGVGD